MKKNIRIKPDRIIHITRRNRIIRITKRISILIEPKHRLRKFKPTAKDYDINLGYIKPNTRLL